MQIVIYKLAIDSGPTKNLYTARKKGEKRSLYLKNKKNKNKTNIKKSSLK